MLVNNILYIFSPCVVLNKISLFFEIILTKKALNLRLRNAGFFPYGKVLRQGSGMVAHCSHTKFNTSIYWKH